MKMWGNLVWNSVQTSASLAEAHGGRLVIQLIKHTACFRSAWSLDWTLATTQVADAEAETCECTQEGWIQPFGQRPVEIS